MKNDKDNLNKGALLSFFDNFKRDTGNLVDHFDTQINILVAINIALLAISLNSIGNNFHLISFSILAFACVASILIGLYAIHPPEPMRRRDDNEDIFYNKRIVNEGEEGYSKSVRKMFENEDEIIKNYSKYFVNMFKNYYRPKRGLFKLSRAILMLGISLGLIFYILESLGLL